MEPEADMHFVSFAAALEPRCNTQGVVDIGSQTSCGIHQELTIPFGSTRGNPRRGSRASSPASPKTTLNVEQLNMAVHQIGQAMALKIIIMLIGFYTLLFIPKRSFIFENSQGYWPGYLEKLCLLGCLGIQVILLSRLLVSRHHTIALRPIMLQAFLSTRCGGETREVFGT
ncbi:hypothetical protein BJ878DRAFT_129115 [Calycina marina]|uniref:Uncharacterized protein n=1 Tax=Calycina marina TaxID=1763456 RepID=A0A9P8CJR9_9HELO|nr:hypothetical protein BJ878DRAFT_129115 [Calycina marina]